MRSSRTVGLGILASSVAHVLALGLILLDPPDGVIVHVPPPVVEVEMAPKAGRVGEAERKGAASPTASSPAPTINARSSTVVNSRKTEVVAGASDSGAPTGDRGEGGPGFESRWRVAPRGRGPLPQPALKPDCSISNSDYVWPGRERFCGPDLKPEG